MIRLSSAAVWALVALVALPLSAIAHDMPSDAVVQMFVKASGNRLQVILRLPLSSLLNLDLPKRGTQYLDLDRIERPLYDAGAAVASVMEVYQGDLKLDKPHLVDVRIALPSDKSFATYGEALSHVTGPRLSENTDVVWDQGFFDALFEYGIQANNAEFSIRPHFESLAPRVTIILRYLAAGAVHAFELDGNPDLVHLDPRWHQAALTFVRAGILHILSGTDHLLFLFCLLVPIRRLGALVPIISAFTIAHSITLIASAYQLAPQASWFPQAIEALIALSIVYMALENILLATVRHRWLIAFGFGLVHGFGFSFALRNTLQFAGGHLLVSLLSFNAGVEIGQLAVLAVVIPVLNVIFRVAVSERVGVAVLSALAAHTGWHWMIERGTAFMEMEWTSGDLISIARFLVGLVFVAATLFLGTRLIVHISHTQVLRKLGQARVSPLGPPPGPEVSQPQ